MAQAIKDVVKGIMDAGCSKTEEEVTALIKGARCKSDVVANFGEGIEVFGTSVAKAVGYMTSHGVGFNPVEAKEFADNLAEPVEPAKAKGLKKSKKVAATA